ncbi:hypothetical protein ADK64_15100 [Streptomyces sp. MMG1121]|nr:hypothetical protein ADK64_15100 [Streptomyces sp. MMG1121]
MADRAMGEESVDGAAAFGGRLLGALLSGARLVRPQMVALLIAERARIGRCDVSMLLQDCPLELLVPLLGEKLHAGRPEPAAGCPPGGPSTGRSPTGVLAHMSDGAPRTAPVHLPRRSSR